MKLRGDVESARLLIAAWRTNNRTTTYLVESLPLALWAKAVPGSPRQTVRMIAAHLHNARCSWIRNLGAKHGVLRFDNRLLQFLALPC